MARATLDVDVMVAPSPEAHARLAAVMDELEAPALVTDPVGAEILVAGLDDLVAMKRASGRPKDLLDVAELTRRGA